MQVNNLGLKTDVMIRRLAGAVIDDRGEWLVVHTPENPGFFWGNYLVLPGPLSAGEGAAWEQVFITEFPNAGHRALAIDGVDGQFGDPAELAPLRVETDISTVLTASARAGLVEGPAVRLPGLHCRALASDGDWEQFLTLGQAADEAPGSLDMFRRRKVAEARALADAGHGAWFGAFIDGRLGAGLGVVSDRRGLARFQDVATHPSHRRLGLARKLLHQAGRHAADALAAHTLVIVADASYHAINLYRSAGFHDTEQQVQLQTPGD